MKTIDELNIDLISKRIPQIIHGVHNAINKRKQFFHEMVKDINTNYELFLKWKVELRNRKKPVHSRDSQLFASNIDIHKLRYFFDPFSFILNYSRTMYNEFMEDYYRLDAVNEKQNDICEVERLEELDPTLRSLGKQGYLLKNINVCNMGFDPYNENLAVPRIKIRSFIRSELTEFMNYQDKDNSNHKGYYESFLLHQSFSQIDQQYAKKNMIKEFMLGQISINDISSKLMSCYKKAFEATYFSYFHPKMEDQEWKETNDRLITFIKAQQAIIDLPEVSYFDKEEYRTFYEKNLSERKELTISQYGDYLKKKEASNFVGWWQLLDYQNPYLIYLFVSHFLDDSNSEKLESDDEKEFVKRLKENFELYLESLIARTTISMITTYFAKIGLSEQQNPLETTHEVIKTLMNETCEDVAYLSSVLKTEEEMESVNNPATHIVREPDDTFSNRKIGKLLRSRLHDYFLLSYLAQNSSKKNYNLSKYFKDDNDYENYFLDFDSNTRNNHNGSKFYNVVYLLLQEIYGHKTVVSNYRKNISGFKNGNFTYVDTFSLASKKMKKYIDSFYKKEFINDLFLTAWNNIPIESFKSFTVEEKIAHLSLNTPNTYSFNSLKNHRALSGILKRILHYLLHLYYVAGSYQEMVKKQSINKVPSYIRQKYLNILQEIRYLSKMLVNNSAFNHSDVSEGIEIIQGQKIMDIDRNLDDFSRRTTKAFFAKAWINEPYRREKQMIEETGACIEMSDICIAILGYSVENYLISSEFVLPYEVQTFFEDLKAWSVNNGDPELFAINPELFQSREELESLKQEAFEKNTLLYDYSKINSHLEKYLKETKANQMSIESILALSLMAESCNKSVNTLTASLEQINERNRNNEKFENLFNKAIDRYRVN